MKLDLRIITLVENGEMNSFNGEFARSKTSTLCKYYDDKAKSVLAGKAHINKFITSAKRLPARLIPTIQYPIIQVMGLNCHVFSLSLVDKNVYILQKIKSLSYPRTFQELRSGGIKKLIDGLNIIKVNYLEMSL